MNNFPGRHSAEQILRFIREKKEDFWNRERERRPLQLFHEAAGRVPAYKDFLKKNKIRPDKIKTFQDFQLVPPINKKNYLQQYPLSKLCWDGSLKKPLVWTSTSGSTGEPFYFPRGHALNWESSILHQLFFENSSLKEKGPTLIIVGFGMGVWIGGLITYQAFEIAARRMDYPISIITPGINKIEIFHALRNLSPNFKQTILVGYPPFIKDIIDETIHERINLRQLHLRILTAAEAYTEKFREYLVKRAGVKNLYLDTLNIYGTADIGTMAWETPTSILMRRLTIQNKKMFREIFSPIEKTPTLAQYNPFFITFESIKDEILLSGSNTIPLIRYAVGDHGGTFNFSDAIEKLKQFNIHFQKEAKKNGLQNNIYKLPFVYVYERKDLSVTLYGLQIYPEIIKEILIEKPFNRFLTGKLTLITKCNKNQNQYLEINLELKKNKITNTRLREFVLRKITDNLIIKNSEFRELHHHLGKRVLPKLVFWPAEHPRYFKPGIKQKWVQKGG